MHDGNQYTCLIEEFLGGGTLRDRLNQSLLSRSEVLLLGSCLMDVLHYLESLDLVGRASFAWGPLPPSPPVVCRSLCRPHGGTTLRHRQNQVRLSFRYCSG